MRNHVTLIRPPRVLFGTYFTSGEAILPLGVAYLVSSLEENNFEVTPIDAIGENLNQYYEFADVEDVTIQGLFIEEIIAKIPKDTMLIGISCMFSCEWFLYEELIKRIREVFPQTVIIVGGEHVTAESENVLKVCPAVDYCVSGEGEETLVELANATKNGLELSKIDGISYLLNGKVIKNKARARIKDLNKIPKPSWDKFPVNNYFIKGNSMTAINRRAMPMIMSRGCPYRCTFCTSPQMWGTDLYLRSPLDIVGEIKSYISKYQVEHIDFVDLVGVLNRAWVKELLTLMIKEDLKISWILGAGTRSEILDDEILMLFKKSNAMRIFYAPESGSKETLKRIKKRINLDKLIKSMKKAQALGISMRAPIIYGFPGQSMKEAFENVLFSLKLSFIGVDDVVTHAFSAHPGSELYYQLNNSGDININKLIEDKKYNLFLRNEFTSKMKTLHSWSSEIPNWLIPVFQFGGMFLCYMVLFTFHPSKIFKTINRVFFLKKPLTVVDHVLYRVFISKNMIKISDKKMLYRNDFKLTKPIKKIA